VLLARRGRLAVLLARRGRLAVLLARRGRLPEQAPSEQDGVLLLVEDRRSRRVRRSIRTIKHCGRSFTSRSAVIGFASC
jgi:hypothetical protein